MRVLLANLKHLYQRRLLWIAYTYFAIMALWPSSDASSQKEAEAVWILALTAGCLVGIMSDEMIAKPVTWCLPKHPLAVRKVAFLIGIVIGVLGNVPVMKQPHPPAQHLTWGLVSTFSASIIAYFSGLTAVLFSPKREAILSNWPALLAWAVIVTGYALAAYSRLELLVFTYPLAMALLGSLVSLGLWVRMGRRAWARQLCASGWWFGPSMQRQAYALSDRRPAGAEHVGSLVESFFLGQMKAGPHYGCARFVWGTVYATWGHVTLLWRFLVLLLILVIIVAEYAGAGAGWVFAWVSFGVVPFSWLPFRSVLLVPAGRRERFMAAVSLGVVPAGVIVVFIVILAIFSIPLSTLVPEIEVWGLSLACHPIPLKTVWVPLLIVPLMAAPRAFFFQARLPVDLLIMAAAPFVLATVVMVLVVVAPFPSPSIHLVLRAVEVLSHVEPATGVTIAIAFAWTLFGAACAYVSAKRSLACS
jgi:hypothetical protein